MFRQIDERTFVAGQLRPEDIDAAKALGVTMIVNNRPDGEEPDQPAGAAIERAAARAGLGYHFIPVSGGVTQAQIDDMRRAFAAADGKVLAFCRAGVRSTFLWALARSAEGDGAEEIMRKAAAAGYDLTPIAAHLSGVRRNGSKAKK